MAEEQAQSSPSDSRQGLARIKAYNQAHATPEFTSIIDSLRAALQRIVDYGSMPWEEYNQKYGGDGDAEQDDEYTIAKEALATYDDSWRGTGPQEVADVLREASKALGTLHDCFHRHHEARFAPDGRPFATEYLNPDELPCDLDDLILGYVEETKRYIQDVITKLTA